MAGRDELETCEAVRPQIAPYTVGKLGASEAASVAAHLAVCDACAKEAAFARVLTSSAPRLPVPAPPPALFEQIARATYAAPPRRSLREALLGFITPAPARLALGTAFAVSIAALVVLPRLSQPDADAPIAADAPVVSAPTGSAPATTDTAPPRDPIAPVVSPSKATLARRTTSPAAPARNETARPKPTDAVATVTPPSEAAVIAPPVLTQNAGNKRTVATTNPAPRSGTQKTASKSANGIVMVVPKTVKRVTPRPPVNPTNEIAPTIAANPVPDTTPDEAPSPAEDVTPKVAPDMSRATQVATLPEAAVTRTGGEGIRNAAKSFRLGGLGGGSAQLPRTLLPSRSARDVVSGSGTVSLVQAPVDVD